MTITRAGFLKAVLGAIGLQGQCDLKHVENCVAAGTLVSSPKEHWYALDGRESKAKCDEGEERCPLGHCQKPRELIGQQDPGRVIYWYEDHFWTNKEESSKATVDFRFPITPRVCSTCGIIYVPVKP